MEPATIIVNRVSTDGDRVPLHVACATYNYKKNRIKIFVAEPEIL